MEPPRYYNRYSDTVATRANLPHWSQQCACFVTFRLSDSLPQEQLQKLTQEREEWLSSHPKPWSESEAREYYELDESFQESLDAGFGECYMSESSIRQLVEVSLRHFDGERYTLYAFVVMPNHVHVLFMPKAGNEVSDILQGWKSFTAKQINRRLGREGSVWQKESWDRLIRNVEQFNAVREYIVQNNKFIAYDAYEKGN